MMRFLFTVGLLLLPFAALTHAAPVVEYQTRLEQALRSLRETSEYQRVAALNQILSRFPAEEEIDMGDRTIKVNNDWIRHQIAAYYNEPQSQQRQRVYETLIARFSALADQVRQASGSEPQSAPRARQRLDEILSRGEFQRQQSESWWDRALDWVRGMVSRLLSRFPGLQRDGGLATPLLQILFWLLAGVMLYVLIRSSIGAPRSKKSVKPSGQRVILGAVIEPHVTSSDLRQEAQELARQGEFRGAIRLLYIALLYEMEDRGWLTFDSAATNRDLLQQLRAIESVRQTVFTLTRQVERFWYGERMPSHTEYDAFLSLYQGVLD